MADLSNKIQVTNPAAFDIGRYVLFLGLALLTVGLVTLYTGDILMPARGWCALAVPAVGIGGILIKVSLTKV